VSTVVQTLSDPAAPTAIATGFESLWVVSERAGTISRIDPKRKAPVRTINVGNGPVAVASGADSVWVANNPDGTVSQIDPRKNKVTATILTGRGPSGVDAARHTVWVANEDGASLTRVDPGTGRPVRHVTIGNRPNGVALVSDSVMVAVRARDLAHRGGSLSVFSGRRGLKTIDPSISYESYTFAIPGLTRDGLVAFKHVGGSDGSTLVPDLAASLQVPTNAGKAYTFELRAGIRYSTGRVVQAEDFRRAIERTFKLESPGPRLLRRDHRGGPVQSGAEELRSLSRHPGRQLSAPDHVPPRRVRRGATITVHVANDGDLYATSRPDVEPGRRLLFRASPPRDENNRSQSAAFAR
jgi:YVTN family beta-propeller protein